MHLLHGLFQLLIALLELGQQARVVHLHAHFDQREQVVARGEQLFIAADLVLQLLHAHLVGLRAGEVVPESLFLGLGLQTLHFKARGIDVECLVEIFKIFL